MISEIAQPTTAVLLRSGGWLDDILIRICVALQLTPTQHREAEDHYLAVAKWLSAPESPLASVKQDIYPQGSLRIGTTVRPWWREEYDLDLVLQLELRQSIDPVALLNLVEARLRANRTYQALVERKNRCIRLTYAKQFHLDILPARPDLRLSGTHILVPDRTARTWKESNPKGYAAWFHQRGLIVIGLAEMRAAAVEPLPLPEEARDKNPLQLAVQLLKRWRDIRFQRNLDLAPISIVLTTLAGQHYAGAPHPFDALQSIVRSINAAIPATDRLRVCNPANPHEDLSERWDVRPDSYEAFVREMRSLERQLHELGSSKGIPEGTRLLETLFGEEVARGVVRSQAKAMEAARSKSSLGVARTGNLTTAVSGAVVVKRNSFYGE
jgi:SMODS domain-containing protein